jgi:acyl carrier protein
MSTLLELQTIFRETFEDDDIEIGPETVADDIEEWDSLTHVGLIMAVERHFGLRFNTTEISNMQNVGDLAKLLDARKS